jgi:hypothetical protein
LYVTVGYLLQRDSGARAARNLDFCRLWLIFCNLERSRLILGCGSGTGIVLRLIQDPRIADSSSRNAVSFSSACTTKRFPVITMRVRNPDCSPVGTKR